MPVMGCQPDAPTMNARLAALVPKPQVNLTRYGVFAPNSPQRREITPRKRGRCVDEQCTDEPKTDVERRASMSLKRVFKVDIETCDACGGAVKLIASIDDPAVIETILAHVRDTPCTLL